mmetsp:Transcript_38115/g.80237  ORF Transcript_38115/g.80237 Transcript_38115/m.80237 type:complete len:164 (-) Transcript_38115:43-534(-)
MSDLIVDFPSQRQDNVPLRERVKAVNFATTNELRFFERNNEVDMCNAWYSDEDYKSMRIENKYAILELHMKYKKLSSASMNQGDVAAEALCDDRVTGIEKFLTSNLINESKTMKVHCRNGVLDQQERQNKSGEYDPIRIACMSQIYSEWSVRRAYTIGMLHSL